MSAHAARQAADCVKTPALSCRQGYKVFCHEFLCNERFHVLASEELTFAMCCLKKPQVIKSSALKQLSQCFGNKQTSMLS